jgi:Vam6/Vps39-like protein vacuolar protein sorting-associated protein 39
VTQELTLSHSPRTIAFLNSGVACLAYQTEHVLLDLDAMTLSDITLPNTNSATVTGLGMGMGMGMGMGALTGLGGYMTLGLGAKEKKSPIVKINDGEVLIPKDSGWSTVYNDQFVHPASISDAGIFVGPDGKPTRPLGLDWQAAPEENGRFYHDYHWTPIENRLQYF